MKHPLKQQTTLQALAHIPAPVQEFPDHNRLLRFLYLSLRNKFIIIMPILQETKNDFIGLPEAAPLQMKRPDGEKAAAAARLRRKQANALIPVS